jgi:hypothetical protein
MLLFLLCLSLLTQAAPPHVGTFRGGSITYKTRGANNLTVDFQLRMSLALDNSTIPKVGQVVSPSLGDTFGFGNGEGSVPLELTVTAVGDGYFDGELNVSHTYAKAGIDTVLYRGDTNRIPNLANNDNLPYWLLTVVDIGAANDSPVSTLPSVVKLAAGQSAATYQVLASDPNGDALTYSLASTADFPPVENPFDFFNYENPRGVSIDSHTGVVTLNTKNFNNGQLINLIVKVSDGKATTLVDHLIQIVDPTVPNTAPVFTIPTPSFGQVFTVAPGEPVTFTLRATDADAGDVVTLSSIDFTTSFTPNLPVSGNPVQATFTWTPIGADAGQTRYLYFTAEDSRGGQRTTRVTIQITSPACNPTATQPVATADQFTAQCSPLRLTPAQLLANDTDPLHRALKISSVSNLTQGRGTLVTNPDGTFTFTAAPGFAGPVSFTYQLALNDAAIRFPATGHYYEFVAAPALTWAQARAAAAARTYNGLQGYLATITSAAEKDFLTRRASGQYWLGATDDEVEGEWRWKTGPEAGQLFWRGGATGTAVGYANWVPGQPDDYKNQFRPAGEDYAQFYGQSGLWNDQAGEGGGTAGYLVEYGAPTECIPVLYATGTVTINVAPAQALVANADQLSTAAGQPVQFTAEQLLANDTDALNRPLTLSNLGVSKPSSGRITRDNFGVFTYTPAPGFNGTATFTYVLQLAERGSKGGIVEASPATGHYYEFVGSEVACWDDAQRAAAASTYQGMQGYLVTVTSAAEKDFLTGYAPVPFWLGAADDEVEGEWRWKTGPEAGQLFWRGGATGTAVGYANWVPGQPDDYKNQFRPAGEDYAQFYGQSGLWNDQARCTVTRYVVEYGGLEACTPVLYRVGTVTVKVGSAPALSKATVTKAIATPAGTESALEAMPNPNAGQFQLRVTAGAEGPAQVDVYDLQGRHVKAVFAGSLQAGEVRELRVEAPELAAGVYLVRLQSGQQVQHLRIAIQK